MANTMITEKMPMEIDSEGVILVGKTRVPLDSIIIAYQEGATPEEIAQQYPTVSLADIYSVIGYYLHEPLELKEYLNLREEQKDNVKKENQTRFNQIGIRKRLLSRQHKGDI